MSTAGSVKIIGQPRIVGDTGKPFAVELYDEHGALLDLTGAAATFKLVDSAATVIIADLACTITASVVSYTPLTGHVATAGLFMGRFKVTLASTLILKVGHIQYEIAADI